MVNKQTNPKQFFNMHYPKPIVRSNKDLSVSLPPGLTAVDFIQPVPE